MYLSPTQIDELRGLLLQAREEIASLLEAGADAAKPVGLDQPIGRLTRMDAIQQQQMARASRVALDLRRGQIQSALAAIDAGTYGECKSCEEPIAYPRLQARPETALCIACREALERR